MLTPIKKARLIAGFTQSELAKKIGVSVGAVSQWEQGQSHPKAGRLRQLAKELNTSVDKLLEDEERAI